MFHRVIRSAPLVIVIASCRSTTPVPLHHASLEQAVQLVVERLLATESVFKDAVEIPICDEQNALPLDIIFIERNIASKEPRVRTCHAGAFTHPAYVHVRSIERVGEDQLVVHAGYYCGPLCADDSTFTLQLTEGVWTIVSVHRNWIS
jgi:hypothetical protein